MLVDSNVFKSSSLGDQSVVAVVLAVFARTFELVNFSTVVLAEIVVDNVNSSTLSH